MVILWWLIVDLNWPTFCHITIDHHDVACLMWLCTRPSRFLACNIENLGLGLGTRISLLFGCIFNYRWCLNLEFSDFCVCTDRQAQLLYPIWQMHVCSHRKLWPLYIDIWVFCTMYMYTTYLYAVIWITTLKAVQILTYWIFQELLWWKSCRFGVVTTDIFVWRSA